MSQAPISPLRRRMIEDMTVRGFGEKTQSDYIRHVRRLGAVLRKTIFDIYAAMPSSWNTPRMAARSAS
jgi:hypothetical protein